MLKKLVLTVWILLSALGGNAQKSDSVKCYTQEELRKIAMTYFKYEECKNLLLTTNNQLRNRMEVIEDQDLQLKLLNKSISHLDTIIANKQDQIDETTKLLKRETRRKKFWKWCTHSVTVVAGVVIVVLATR